MVMVHSICWHSRHPACANGQLFRRRPARCSVLVFGGSAARQQLASPSIDITTADKELAQDLKRLLQLAEQENEVSPSPRSSKE